MYKKQKKIRLDKKELLTHKVLKYTPSACIWTVFERAGNPKNQSKERRKKAPKNQKSEQPTVPSKKSRKTTAKNPKKAPEQSGQKAKRNKTP
jgi:hypothetical protein